MGKMLLFLIIGIGGLFSIANLNIINSNNNLLDTSIEQWEKVQSKKIAECGISYSIMQINQDTSWSGISGLAMCGGTLSITAIPTNSQYPSGPNMNLTGMREIMSVGIVSDQEDTVWAVLKLSDVSVVPPFLSYAVASENDLGITGGFSVVDDGNPNWNANVHTNSDLVVQGGGYSVEGFGSYVGSMRKDHGGGTPQNNFSPNVNSDGSSTAFQGGRVDIPAFNPDDYISIATSITNGDLSLRGSVNLGTLENPGIWYVDGDLDFHGNVEGYGVFIVTGTVNFHGNITVSGLDDDGSNAAFYSQGGIDIHGNTTIYGQIYSEGNITSHGSFDLYGSMTSKSTIDLQGGGTIHYRPATTELTDPFWNSTTPGPPEIVSYYHL